MSFISSAVPLLNGMKMQRTTRIKRILKALTLSVILPTSVNAAQTWACVETGDGKKPFIIKIMQDQVYFVGGDSYAEIALEDEMNIVAVWPHDFRYMLIALNKVTMKYGQISMDSKSALQKGHYMTSDVFPAAGDCSRID